MKVSACLTILVSHFVFVSIAQSTSNYTTDTTRIAKCDNGTFDILCDKQCHCLNDLPCSQDGVCPFNRCAPGYGGPTCSECAGGFFGENCTETCHCLNGTSACNSQTGECVGGCDVGYEGNACQIVNGFPIIMNIKKLEFNKGQSIVVSCIAYGAPQPNITITSFSGLMLLDEDIVSNSNDSYELVATFDSAMEAGLENFSCIAENVFGSVNDSFRITIIEPPFLRIAPTINGQSAESVSFVWNSWDYNTDGGGTDGDDVDYMVEYRQTGHDLWFNSSIWQKNTSITVDGLLPDTDYEFAVRCRRHGEGGIGRRGEVFQSYTKCGMPNVRGIPQNLAVDHVTEDSVVISWQPPLHSDLKCTLVKYRLTYTVVGSGLQMGRLEINGTAIRHILTHLKGNTQYEISLQAITDGPLALNDAVIVVDTPDYYSTEAKTDIVIEPLDDPRAIGVNWKESASQAKKEYLVVANLIKVGKCDNIPYDIQIVTFPIRTNETKVKFFNLEPFSTYNVEVFSAAKSDDPELLQNVTYTTPQLKPSGKPRNIKVEEIGKTHVILRWDPIACHQLHNDVVRYRYSVHLLDSGDDDLTKTWKNRTVTTDSHFLHEYTVNVTGLTPDSSYNFAVEGVSDIGVGPSAVIQYKTKRSSVNAPTILPVRHVNSTTVTIEWMPPKDDNETVTNYMIQYTGNADLCKEKEWKSNNDVHVVETTDSITTVVDLFDLKAGLVYCVRVSAKYSSAFGDYDSSVFMTEDDFNSRRVATIVPPKPPPPVILDDDGDLKKTQIKIRIYPLDNFKLYPNVMFYDVLVALSDKAEDQFNGSACHTYDSVFIQKRLTCWIAARLSAGLIEDDDNKGFIFTLGDVQLYNEFFNGPLVSGQSYAIMIRAVDRNQVIFSPLSAQVVTPAEEISAEEVTHCYILEISCPWFFLLVILLIIVLWIILACIVLCLKQKNRKKIKIRQETCLKNNVSMAYRTSKHFDGGTEMMPLNTNSSSKMESFKKCNFYGPIKVKDLVDYIHLKNTHTTCNFDEEFKHVVRGQSFQWNEAKKAENIKKNRYGNILPYDQSRVRLNSIPGIPNSDYINASYIDGYNQTKAYIVAQGPKENTFHDFWRMIWQENVSVIVMLTALVENKKKKCDQYWPNQSRLYGDILVNMINSEQTADITIRHLELKIVGTSNMRRVIHFHHNDWPDLDVPPCVSSILDLRRRVYEEQSHNNGPVVVHCSGGAGRSGTFVAIDAMLKQACEEDQVHIHKYVNGIRAQRTCLVQTLDQYKFVYEAILEALQSGNTQIMPSRLSGYFRKICKKPLDSDATSDLEEQFNKLRNLTNRKSSFPSTNAMTNDNACKNRDPAVLPMEHSRVMLKDEQGFSPYINAISCDGLKQKSQFLVTQMPLDCTIEDFWSMVYQHKSTVIVMLNDCEFIDENVVPGQYWPNDGCTQYGPFLIEVVTFEEKGMVNIRTLQISNLNKFDSESHSVYQLQFLAWIPESPLPQSSSSMVTLLNITDVFQHKLGGPITVHCNDGATRSGLFCAAHLIKEQIESGDDVDIFQAVKRIRHHRPQFITSTEQYKFCYEVAMELTASITNGKQV